MVVLLQSARLFSDRVSWSVCAGCRCQASRSVATLQKRKPSRMVLSPDVAKSRPPVSSLKAKSKKGQPNAFGGLNQTVANIVPAGQRQDGRRAFKGSQKVLPKTKARPARQAFKALKMQRALAPVSYDKRNKTKETIQTNESFAHLPLLPIIKDSIGPQALGGRLDIVASPIQKLAIPALLKASRGQAKKDATQHFLLAAETGSGKTLAYLLPVIDAIKRAEAEGSKGEASSSQEPDSSFDALSPKEDRPDSDTGRPRAIILVPTAELVDQVGAVVKAMSHTVKFRSALLSSNYSGPIIRSRLFNPRGIDVVVSTPHLLSSIIEADPNIVARVTHLVIDEADSLLDRSFSPTTRAILDRAAPSLKQLILCSATIPRKLDSYLEKHFPEVVRLTTPNLHAIPRRIQLSVVDVEGQPYRGNRNLACADTIWNMGKELTAEGNTQIERTLRLIVFVNERETTEEISQYLKGKGIDAFALNRDAGDRRTSDILAEFTGLQSQKGEEPARVERSVATMRQSSAASLSRNSRLPNVKVLVMTDIGSRGIDTVEVRNVILYDVPYTSIDFIHRLGRVGRMGRRGRGYVLVGKGDRKDIVKEVRTGMFMGKALI